VKLNTVFAMLLVFANCIFGEIGWLTVSVTVDVIIRQEESVQM